MGIVVDVSFDVNKIGNVFIMQDRIVDEARRHECVKFYDDFDMDDESKHGRSHCVTTITFHEDQMTQCSKFIATMKSWKNVHVECVYEENKNCNIRYASTSYMRSMEKMHGKAYRAQRSRGFTETDLTPVKTNHSRRRSNTHIGDVPPDTKN